MAVSIINLFNPVQLTSTAVTLYTVPATPVTNVLQRGRIRFVNTDTAVHSVTAYAFQSAGSATVTTTFVPGVAIGANSYLDTDVPVLGPGGVIQAKADSANVSATPLDGILFS